jgi:hypothetical protein
VEPVVPATTAREARAARQHWAGSGSFQGGVCGQSYQRWISGSASHFITVTVMAAASSIASSFCTLSMTTENCAADQIRLISATSVRASASDVRVVRLGAVVTRSKCTVTWSCCRVDCASCFVPHVPRATINARSSNLGGTGCRLSPAPLSVRGPVDFERGGTPPRDDVSRALGEDENVERELDRQQRGDRRCMVATERSLPR